MNNSKKKVMKWKMKVNQIKTNKINRNNKTNKTKNSNKSKQIILKKSMKICHKWILKRIFNKLLRLMNNKVKKELKMEIIIKKRKMIKEKTIMIIKV